MSVIDSMTMSGPTPELKLVVLNPTRLRRVGVGIMIAHNPFRGSGQAAFPHPALTLGDNAHAAERIRMIDANRRQPADGESMHPIPRDTTGLATTQKSVVAELSDLDSKQMQRVLVHGYAVMAIVPSDYRSQPLNHWDGPVHASPEFVFHLVQLPLQPFANRLPQHRKPSIASFLPTYMRKPEEVERFRSPFSTLLSVLGGRWSELQ